MASGSHDSDLLRLFTPELPAAADKLGVAALADQLFLENCADRLTLLGLDAAVRLKSLETVNLSLDGLTYRLTLKKGIFFHCGAELTANDAVATIQRVLMDDHSASRLHHFVARDKSPKHGWAVHSVSRLRLEIRLTRRLPDLLARLALPEFSLRHEGRACFSGLWRVVERDTQGLLLTVHAKHADAPLCQYKGIRWERLLDVSEFHATTVDRPFLKIFPGSQFKSPPEELLADEICRPLAAGCSLLVHIDAKPEVSVEVRQRLLQAARLCFGKGSLWQRWPLTSLVPKSHALYRAFTHDPPVSSGRHLMLNLMTQAAGASVPAQVWEKLCRTCADELNMTVNLVPVGTNLPPQVQSADAASGQVKVVTYGHAADFYTPLAVFAAERGEQVAKESEGHGKVSRLDAEFCQNLPRTHQYAPFLAVPYVMRSNRNVKPSDTTSLLSFTDVRQSSDQVRKLRQTDAALKSLGAALQMFIHDVRRPFSLVQGITQLLDSAASPTRLRELAVKYLPDVKQAVTSVDRLIQDILEIGSDAEPNCEDVVISDLLAGVLHETFSLNSPATVTFAYRFQHRHALHADPQKIARVFSNLINNAAEAMKVTGQIWFATTEDDNKRQVSITVGNTNSFIPEDIRGGLFDRFFTEGKKRGTGLGLAIVKKIVNDHGGDVWCESDQINGTQFIFTLPLSPRLIADRGDSLPRRGDNIKPTDPVGAAPLARGDALDFAFGANLRLLLVDDNSLYLEMIQELLTVEERRRSGVQFDIALDASSAAERLRHARYDGAIIDVDLGLASENGLELIRRLRELQTAMKICVHSNGPPFELQKKALAAGADLFLPKPMSREHLIRLLQSIAAKESRRPLSMIAVVDDDALHLETWRDLPGYHWITYDSPLTFLENCAKNPEFLGTLLCVVTDYTFAGGPDTGVTLAAALAKQRADLPIFLATNHPAFGTTEEAAILAVIPKEAKGGLAAIEKILPTLLRERRSP